jgi:hypothetical protein
VAVRILTDEHIALDIIYWALLQYLEPDPEVLRSQVYRLPPATPEFIAAHPR